MTLRDFFDYISQNPEFVLYYFLGLPVLAAIIGIISHKSGETSPYRELFMVIIYAVTIPGIFALFLNVYIFLFENRSIMDLNIHTQILPVFSMIATLLIIRRFARFDAIPGFGKISGLMMMIAAVIVLLWVLDRFRIIAFVYMPFYYLIIIVVVLLIAINYGLKKIIN
ncbi:MAG: hypothetical protein ACM3PT_12150 [Deltaproteobacteria bacterium]